NRSEGRDSPIPLVELSEKDLPKTEEEKKAVAKLPVRNMIGRLWWLATQTRPDIFCALHKCAKWQNKPSQKLHKYIIYIMRYLRHTTEYGLVFKRQPSAEVNKGRLINAFCDSSFATEEGSKSRYGYYFFGMGALVSWTSSNSTRIMTSSTEAECHALVHASKENLWIREFLTEFTLCPKISPSLIFQDNKSSIALSVGGPSHRRS